MKALLFILALLACAIFFAARSGDTEGNRVTLRAAPGNSVVQLLGATNSAAAVLKQLPSGTVCEIIDEPKAVTIEGIAMSFYKLNCGGATGYVNAKWVTH